MTVPYVPFSEFEQSEQFPHASSRAVMEQIITHNVQSVVAGDGITVNSTDPENPIVSATAYSLPQATPLLLGGMKLGTTFIFNAETGLTDVADYLSETAANLAYAPIDAVSDFAATLFTGAGANLIGYTPVVGPVETVQECLHTHDQELSDHETVINNTVSALNNAVNALNALIADYGVGDGLVNAATFRLNLDVYSKSEGDTRYLEEASNLFDLDNVATARTNLDVYSKEETNAAIASGYIATLKAVASGKATDSTKNIDLLTNITINSYSKDIGANTVTWVITVSGLVTPFSSNNFVVVANGYNIAFGSGSYVDGDTFTITGFYADNGMDATSATINFTVFMLTL